MYCFVSSGYVGCLSATPHKNKQRYVPNFNEYTNKVIPDRIDWYTSQNIYENVKMNDNINAYYGLANESITKLQSIISDEPNIWR